MWRRAPRWIDWLRNAAQATGVEFVPTTYRPEAEGVMLADGDIIHAPCIIDARGRNAHRERKNIGPAALVIFGWASAAGIRQGRRIAAIEQGWLWRIAFPNGRVWAQFTGDAAQPGNLDERLRHALVKAEPDASGIAVEGASARTRSRAVAAMLAGRSSHPARRGCAGCRGSPVGARSVLGSIECLGRSRRSALSGRTPR